MERKKPELIMPAGSMDALKASVINGADAVYFGAKRFNARISAHNFSEEEMKDAIDFCHLLGKKAYLTINILIKDSEMEEAIELAKSAYEKGIDAIIVQDLGLVNALHALLPDLELHASTQMTCHNSAGAKFLENLGVKKIVLARELSLEEIKEIKKSTKAEVECFVHGALCFSYSGQCLFSSFAFNKSGNRGMCLQPCRLPYKMESKDGKEKKEGFLLSMKDLMTAEKVNELIEAGIDAFKVEGRIKGVEYCAAVARAYRHAIDSHFDKKTKLTEEEIKMMKIGFLRENTKGYLFNEKEMAYPESPARKGIPAAEVLGFDAGKIRLKLIEELSQWEKLSAIRKDEIDEFKVRGIFWNTEEKKTAFPGEIVSIETINKPYLEKGEILYFTTSEKLRNFAYASITRISKAKYSLQIKAVVGKKLCAEAAIGEKKVCITSDFIPEKSKTGQTTENMIKGKVFKASDFFEPSEFSCTLEGNPFLPVSELKKFKRKIMDEMREALFSENRKKVDGKEFEKKKKEIFNFREINPSKEMQRLAVFIDRKVGDEIIRGAEIIACYDSMEKNEILEMKSTFPEKDVFVKSANMQSDRELYEFEKEFMEAGDAKVACSNLGALQKAIENKTRFIADRELNIFNSLSVSLIIGLGADAVVPSVECSLKQIGDFAFGGKLIPLVFFRPLLMTSKAYSKAEQGREYFLTDRKNFRYKVLFDENGLMRIYNPKPVDMIYEIEKFSRFSAIGIDLKASCEKEARSAIARLGEKNIGNKIEKSSDFTRGHYEKEVF